MKTKLLILLSVCVLFLAGCSDRQPGGSSEDPALPTEYNNVVNTTAPTERAQFGRSSTIVLPFPVADTPKPSD